MEHRTKSNYFRKRNPIKKKFLFYDEKVKERKPERKSKKTIFEKASYKTGTVMYETVRKRDSDNSVPAGKTCIKFVTEKRYESKKSKEIKSWMAEGLAKNNSI